jgi:nucleoside-diphosphate-sugar epimerase
MSKILVIGASGQIGTELTVALRKRHGGDHVIAADLKSGPLQVKNNGPFIPLDVLDRETLQIHVRNHRIDTIYLLAAMLSANGEQYPHKAWDLNMRSLLNVLEVARIENIRQVFWPSSIAVFGPDAPKEGCPQHTELNPSTVYGISKLSGEQWCQYYHGRYGMDIRSLRYPGLISSKTLPGGGTTDYAIHIFHSASYGKPYTCFLRPDTRLPMMYMDDAVRATIELMNAPQEKITIRSSYNIAAMSFTPAELAEEIKQYVPEFDIVYAPDQRQAIADSWPSSIDDSVARKEWGWISNYNIAEITSAMFDDLRVTAG